MNVKAMAAIVGTLSLGTLATGCATGKPVKSSVSSDRGSQYACKVDVSAARQVNSTAATATAEKASEHSCGNSSCGGAAAPQ
ncbi:hypothetical protein [Archangium lipolyticum]|uniref:hypothetical protein n=1 Tax=Archangium lipolyticum TaxID=2970465 RepID=UPI002149A966|nr:hypothetical protein [Archangium lipolyticum]